MLNILLITIDCLRADRLDHTRYQRRLTPQIDRLAKRSVVFSRAFATGPRTAESFPAILASTYPMSFDGNWKLPNDLRTLAQVLQEADYTTAAFHSNPFLSANLGFAKGFHHFWDSRDATPMTSKAGARLMSHVGPDTTLRRIVRRFARHFEARVNLSYYATAATVTGKALAWLEQQIPPFFLWVHYMDLHYPYAPPENYIRMIRPNGVRKRQQADLIIRSLEDPASFAENEAQILRDLYDAGLVYIDSSVGQLLEAFSQMGLRQNTAVILTSDHGEEFLEHGEFGHGGNIHVPAKNRARIRLFDELLHVPLIFHDPNETVSPQINDNLVSLIDLPPTIVDVLGLSPVDQWQGRSLTPLIYGAEASNREAVFSEYAVRGDATRWPIVSYRTNSWKYIHDGAFGHHELYDLTVDPSEQRNLYSPNRPVSQAMALAVERHLDEVREAQSPVPVLEMDAETVERLHNLGYIE